MSSHLRDLAPWKRLVQPAQAPLLQALRDSPRLDAARLEGLRRDWPRELVELAVELEEARRRAAVKFSDGDRWICDRAGVEQATGEVVARHKARRFHEVNPTRILDLCSGIGGDARFLGEVAPVLAVDRSPVRAWMTRHNSGASVVALDVERHAPPAEVVHLDPARRSDQGRRSWRLADSRPGPEFVARLVAERPHVAVKLGPGVEVEQLSTPPGSEVEWVSEQGRLVQAILWTGGLARHPGHRTATRLPAGDTLSGRPGRPLPGDGEPGAFLVVPDPALERCGLSGPVGQDYDARELSPGLGILTAARPVPGPWFESFEIEATLPWRVPRLRQWLGAHDGGVVEVRTRGRAVDVPVATRELRGRGSRRYVVFGLRLGAKKRAFITRPRAGRSPER